MIRKSQIYLDEEKKFARNLAGQLTYNGKVVCRYYTTSKGCNKSRCSFSHIRLGCVFHRLANQGCVFQENFGKECPFSHSPDAVVVSGPLYQCSVDGCNRSCMHMNSTCIKCFNKNRRTRNNNHSMTSFPRTFDRDEMRKVFADLFDINDVSIEGPSQSLEVKVSPETKNPEEEKAPAKVYVDDGNAVADDNESIKNKE